MIKTTGFVYSQKQVNLFELILATNASFAPHKTPSATTMMSKETYGVFSLDFSNVLK